jgi:Phytanoyl-CoA dioxygenase (PhyH)
MHTVYFDSPVSDEIRRQRLYNGQLFVFSPRPSTLALRDLARNMIQEAFGSLDPKTAQYHMSVEKYVAIVAPLKPQFIHHPQTKGLIRDILEDLSCDLEKTYLDVPRLRMVTSDGYLTSGVGYAHHPHRDTWYSAPLSQLNWWLPIYDIESESSMAFHPRYWSQPVQNESSSFNYYEWNKNGRKNASQHIKSDTRKQPRPIEPIELDPQVRVVCPAGGIVLFSGAQLHSTVPNTSGLTRYSIDFRTVHLDEVVNMGGAPNLDSACTGTSLRDFMRGTDFSRLPENIVSLYDEEKVEEGLIFQPEIALTR